MAGTVSDLIGTLKGSISKELLSREGRRLSKKKPEEEPLQELSGGQTIQPRSTDRAFEGEDSAESKKAFDEEFGS